MNEEIKGMKEDNSLMTEKIHTVKKEEINIASIEGIREKNKTEGIHRNKIVEKIVVIKECKIEDKIAEIKKKMIAEMTVETIEDSIEKMIKNKKEETIGEMREGTIEKMKNVKKEETENGRSIEIESKIIDHRIE